MSSELFVCSDVAANKWVPLTPAMLAGGSGSSSGTPANRSGTLTTGGTAQQLMPANALRRGLWVQNLSTGDLWINDLGTAAAVQPSLKVPSGAYFETPQGYGPVGAVSIFGATTGQAFCAREW